jgi:hypothetical protein
MSLSQAVALSADVKYRAGQGKELPARKNLAITASTGDDPRRAIRVAGPGRLKTFRALQLNQTGAAKVTSRG